MEENQPPRRFTLRGILKIIFFPFLFMVSPKSYFMGKEDEDP